MVAVAPSGSARTVAISARVGGTIGDGSAVAPGDGEGARLGSALGSGDPLGPGLDGGGVLVGPGIGPGCSVGLGSSLGLGSGVGLGSGLAPGDGGELGSPVGLGSRGRARLFARAGGESRARRRICARARLYGLARRWRRARRAALGRRRGVEILGDRHRVRQPIGRVVVGVDRMSRPSTGPALDARPGSRRRGGRPLDEGVGGVAPAHAVERTAADRPEDEGPAGRREAARVRHVGDRRVDPCGVRQQEMAARPQQQGRRPGCLPCRRGPTGGHVDQLDPGEVERRCTDVRQLDPLIGSRGAAGHHLGHDEPTRRGPADGCDRVHRQRRPRRDGQRRPGERCSEREDGDEDGDTRPPGAFHGRPPGGDGWRATSGPFYPTGLHAHSSADHPPITGLGGPTLATASPPHRHRIAGVYRLPCPRPTAPPGAVVATRDPPSEETPWPAPSEPIAPRPAAAIARRSPSREPRATSTR